MDRFEAMNDLEKHGSATTMCGSAFVKALKATDTKTTKTG